MYDEESGFYYLRSRYYDPFVGRFLNADGVVTTGQGFDGHNMFAYCGNNPVMRADASGQFWGLVILAVAIVATAALTSCSKKTEPDPIEPENSTANTIAPSAPTDTVTESTADDGMNQLKTAPAALIYTGNNIDTYESEDDVSVIARMLYGEDYTSAAAHLWVLENRRLAGNYGGSDFRSLILAKNQFSCMNGHRSLDPASHFEQYGELAAWEECVDLAYSYVNNGICSIPKPSENFNYTWTYQYSESIARIYPNGVRIGGTWFYNK